MTHAVGMTGKIRRSVAWRSPFSSHIGVLAGLVLAAGAVASCTPQPPAPTANSAASSPTGDINEAGDIPDSQVFVTVTAPDGAFTIKVPEGWSKTDVGGVVTFTDKLNAVEIASRPATKAPTIDSVDRGEVPAIMAATRGFRPGMVSQVTRSAGEVVLLTYGADSEPNPVTGKTISDAVERYSFYRPGVQVTVTLTGPAGADNVDPWRIVTDSFTWLP